MSKNRIVAIALLAVLGIFAALYIQSLIKKPNLTSTRKYTGGVSEPKFRHDANLQIIRFTNGDTAANLKVEVADDEYEITTGLMYRSQMASDAGMLFLFPDETRRSFWMKNTKIPLDIIFINSAKRIVTIQRSTTPFSESSIPSTGPAQYVLELNAGVADQLSLSEGDYLNWQLIP